MADKKDPNNPSTTSAAWDAMLPTWTLIQTLLAGTEAMRAAGQLYLPQHAHEISQNYHERLNQNVLFNVTELTLDTWVGKPFGEGVKLLKDVPEKIVALEGNIDLMGTDLTSFCREWFRTSLAYAFAHVLVDFPRPSNDGQRTMADDLQDNLRPYWTLVHPMNVIALRYEMVNGVEQVVHVRIREDIVVHEGFVEVYKERIRVLEPGLFWVYELVERKGKKEKWVLIDSGEIDLPIVPFVTFYTNRLGPMLGKPPIKDLALLNVRHWQSMSDQINVLTVARFPMLAVSGLSENANESLVVGPRQLLGVKDANGKFYYVEHSGKAIAAGRQDLMDLEEMMTSYGAQYLRRRPGNATATGRALDSAESVSPLQDATMRFKNAVCQALKYTAQWYDLDDPITGGGSIELETDFGDAQTLENELRGLIAARQLRDISRHTFLEEMKRRDLISDEVDLEKNEKELLTEKQPNPLESKPTVTSI